MIQWQSAPSGAAKERGLNVGRDLAITGFDDTPMIQYMDPPLTSVRQPTWQVGQQIIPLLLDTIEHGHPSQPIENLIEPSLIVRGSSTGQKFKIV